MGRQFSARESLSVISLVHDPELSLHPGFINPLPNSSKCSIGYCY